MGLARKTSAVLCIAVVGLGFGSVESATAAKKAKSCTLLKASQIANVLGAEVTGPNQAGTSGIACDFDIGTGLGDPGGGIVIVSYYTGNLAKGVYSAAKSTAEKIPGTKALWDANVETAMIFTKGKLVSVGVTYTSDDPPADSLQPEMAKLAALAAKRA